MPGLPFDPALVSEPPGTLPLGTDAGISTGRAADLGRGLDLSAMLNPQPSTGDRWQAFFHGLSGGDAAGYLQKLQDAKSRQAMDFLKFQLELQKFVAQGSTQQLQAFQTFATTLKTVADSSATASPEERDAMIKGLESAANESGMPALSRALIRPMLSRPDIATVFPDLVPFMHPGLARVYGARMVEKPELAWEASVANIQAVVDQRAARLGDTLGKVKSFDAVVSVLADGNQAIADYLYGRLPEEVEKRVGGVRDRFLDRLSQLGVTRPSTTAKAQEAGAVAGATERAKLESDITAGQARAAGEKVGAEERARLQPDIAEGKAASEAVTAAAKRKAELAPEIIALEARRAAAMTAATEAARQKYETGKPLSNAEVGGLRGQFLAQSKDFADTIRAFQRIEDSAQAPSAAGDLAMIFNYMRMLDPTSTVREGEFATAQQSAGVPTQVRNLYNRLLSGERLAPEQRQDFLTRSRMLVKGQLDQHEQIEGQFKAIAAKGKADPETAVPDIVGKLRQTIKATPAPTAQRAATRAEVDAAKREAGGNAQKARQLLIDQGIDPSLPVK